MDKRTSEWLKQAEYDIETAEFMNGGKRYFYAVFMCHLSIEKALKGLYQHTLQEVPPKTHNLIYLLNKIGIKPNEKIGTTIARLNEAHITTRYPEELDRLKNDFTHEVTEPLLVQTKELFEWIKKQF